MMSITVWEIEPGPWPLKNVNIDLLTSGSFCGRLHETTGISGKQDSASLDAKKSVRTLIIPFRGFPRTRNFSGWTSVKSPKISVLEVVK